MGFKLCGVVCHLNMFQIYVCELQTCVWAVIYKSINNIEEKKLLNSKMKKAKTEVDQMRLGTKRPRPKL
jgi:hypothetical protein